MRSKKEKLDTITNIIENKDLPTRATKIVKSKVSKEKNIEIDKDSNLDYNKKTISKKKILNENTKYSTLQIESQSLKKEISGNEDYKVENTEHFDKSSKIKNKNKLSKKNKEKTKVLPNNSNVITDIEIKENKVLIKANHKKEDFINTNNQDILPENTIITSEKSSPQNDVNIIENKNLKKNKFKKFKKKPYTQNISSDIQNNAISIEEPKVEIKQIEEKIEHKKIILKSDKNLIPSETIEQTKNENVLPNIPNEPYHISKEKNNRFNKFNKKNKNKQNNQSLVNVLDIISEPQINDEIIKTKIIVEKDDLKDNPEIIEKNKDENVLSNIPNEPYNIRKEKNNRFNKFNKKNKNKQNNQNDVNEINLASEPQTIENITKTELIVDQDVLNFQSEILENIKDENALPNNPNEHYNIRKEKNNRFNKFNKKNKNKQNHHKDVNEINLASEPQTIENFSETELIVVQNDLKDSLNKNNALNNQSKNKHINSYEQLTKSNNTQGKNSKNKVVQPPPKNQPKPKIPIITSKELNENTKIKELFNKVMNFIEMDLSLLHGSKILLGISGGIDSIVLLDIFFNIAKKYSFQLYVIHFNHLLRGKESDDDQKLVEQLCEKYLIPFFSTSGNVKEYALKNGFSIETAARELRYEFFQRKAQSLSATYVATAHHSNDNSETFLLNLFRGSGLTGLTGIPFKREIMKNIFLVRPIIKLTKEEIKYYADFRKLIWREDSSNQFSNYKRNNIRLNLIKLIEKEYCSNFNEIIARTTDILKSADQFIQEHLEYLLKFIQKEKKGSRLRIKLNALVNNSTFIQGELLQKILTENYKIQNLPNNAIQRIISLFEAPVGTQIDVNNNIIAVRDRFEIAFAKNKEIVEIDKQITKIGLFKIGDLTIKLEEVQKNQVKFNLGNHIEFFDYDLVGEVLQIRNWQNGDSFHPIGMQSIVKLSDFLTNKKVPVLDKKNILVLCSENDIIWVLKNRINDNYKITDNTIRYLKIEII